MISILISVHDCFVDKLVSGLHRQAANSGKEFEIIISDDASLKEYRSVNEKLQELPHVSYHQQEKDLKRAGNRNFLGRQAKYRYLLFIDGDALVSSNDFINKYLECCQGQLVVCGGTAYMKEPPADSGYFLRWIYGWKREVKSAESRSRKPGESFSAFNFLIEKSLFLENPFPEKITDYGHEDTIFGLKIFRKGYHVKHIDNTLIHGGLEPNREFLDKSLNAVENLYHLLSDKEYQSYLTGIRIARWYTFCRKTGIYLLFRWFYPWIKRPIEHNLFSHKPDLFLFDLYRLGYMLQMDNINLTDNS